MAESKLLRDRHGSSFKSDLPLFECCSCRSLRHQPVLLNCLHIYCRSCINTKSNKVHMLKAIVKCYTCSEVTELNEVTTNSLLLTYQRSRALFCESLLCSKCDADEELAMFWCVDCYQGLCGSCYSRHNLHAMHHRSAELDVARTWSLCQLTPSGGQCSLHNRQMDAYCFLCCVPKCLHCCELCRAMGHDMRPLIHDKTHQHLSKVIDTITSTRERLKKLLSEVLPKRLETTNRLRAVHSRVQKLLRQHRYRLHESTVTAFDKSVIEVCVNLDRIWFECPDDRARSVWLICSRYVEGLSVGAFPSVQLVRAARLLKTIALRCASLCRDSEWRLRQSWKKSGSISIGGAAPLTADVVLSACLGATYCMQATPHAPLLFGQVFVTIETPVNCFDLAMTRDGHVLLAAREHGLLVYSDRGQQLSSWRPERQSNGVDDWVNCVTALSSGGAAVGVFYAQLVVLLKLSQTGDTWLQDRRVVVLQSPPSRLAAHGDLLAATEDRLDEQQQQRLWVRGREVKLLKLSSGQLLYTQSRDYGIDRVALTALCVVTKSLRPVKRNSGAEPYVLDAFSHSGEFLWRHETSDEELMTGLCVSADTWSRVYVAVWRRDWSSCRLMAIGGADGRDIREVMSSRTRGLQLPASLSLARGQQRTVLAVLSRDRTANQFRTVSLYEATSV